MTEDGSARARWCAHCCRSAVPVAADSQCSLHHVICSMLSPEAVSNTLKYYYDSNDPFKVSLSVVPVCKISFVNQLKVSKMFEIVFQQHFIVDCDDR